MRFCSEMATLIENEEITHLYWRQDVLNTNEFSSKFRAFDELELNDVKVPRLSAGKEDISDEELSYVSDVNELYSDEEETHTNPLFVVKRFWGNTWKTLKFEKLPVWMQDNEFLRSGHRPQLPSLWLCLKSITALHSETGNIWSHMYGCIAFFGVALWVFIQPSSSVPNLDKLIFSAFFAGAVVCLGMSAAFHTLYCHSEEYSVLFAKLDYSGIAALIMGSFVPWLYYGFYCRPQPTIIYISMITFLGIAAVTVSLWNKFAAPKYRPLRATVFMSMGLSAIIPTIHIGVVDGMEYFINEAGFTLLFAMGVMYIGGATLYAARVPERFFPGKCDIWFQSHQIFHTLVVAACFTHLYNVISIANIALQDGSCAERLKRLYGVEGYPSIIGSWFGLDEDPATPTWSEIELGLSNTTTAYQTTIGL